MLFKTSTILSKLNTHSIVDARVIVSNFQKGRGVGKALYENNCILLALPQSGERGVLKLFWAFFRSMQFLHKYIQVSSWHMAMARYEKETNEREWLQTSRKFAKWRFKKHSVGLGCQF